jgi:hypothetical protein
MPNEQNGHKLTGRLRGIDLFFEIFQKVVSHQPLFVEAKAKASIQKLGNGQASKPTSVLVFDSNIEQPHVANHVEVQSGLFGSFDLRVYLCLD